MIKYKTTISETVDEHEWNTKLLESNDSSTYQTTNWAQVFKFAHDSKPLFISVRDNDSKLVGQLCSIIHKKFFWNRANTISKFIGEKLDLHTSIKWDYGPIIHDSMHNEEILSQILDALDQVSKQNNVTMISGSTPPSKNKNLEPLFAKHGFSEQKWSTNIIHLQTKIDEYYNSLNKKTRYDIRKSEEKELTFEVVNDHSSYVEFQNLKNEANKIAGLPINKNPKVIVARTKFLDDFGHGKLFLVRHENQLLAGIVGILFNGKIIQDSVAISSNRNHLQGDFLTWNFLKWCHKKKFSFVDVGGVNPNPISQKEKSINFFKSKWGGEKLDYYYYVKILDRSKSKISSLLQHPGRIKNKIKTTS